MKKREIKYLLHGRNHIVYFDKKAIENYDKSQGGIIMVRSNSRAEFSIEWGYIHDTCEPGFFSPGDKVLIAYDVFRLGRYMHIAKDEKSRNILGTDFYRASKDEVVAKYISGPDGKESILPKPGWVLVEAPPSGSEEVVSSGGIIIPQVVVSEQKKKAPDWATVSYSNSDSEIWAPKFENGEEVKFIRKINPGDVVLIGKWQFLPFDSIKLLAVKEENIMAVKT